MKRLYNIGLLLVTISVFSQIKITEVNYDTPFLENNNVIREANQSNPNTVTIGHLGEYIELYNYTTEDISLDGWYIADHIGTYYFPTNVIIKSGGFLVVAYKPQTYSTAYFPTFFPTTVGKEAQILYQDVIEIRNDREELRLGTRKLKGNIFNIPNVSFVDWEEGSLYHPMNHYNNYATGIHSGDVNTNTYYNKSLHDDNGNQYKNYYTANPLEEAIVPPLQVMESLPLVIDAYINNYAGITWASNVDAINNKFCFITIPLVQQTPNLTLVSSGKCFNYDFSGNATSTIDCSPITPTNPPINGYTEDELQEIENSIQIAPNPTTGYLYVTWGNAAAGKISGINIVAINGTYNVYVSITSNQSNAQLNLVGQPNGIYIVRMTLDSGQFISKNILKM